MEIHFFWIENFANIKGKGISLSSKYIIKSKLTKIDNIRKGKIEILNNPDFIPNFFDKPKLSNVSAIIGRNGSGKTSILDYIKTHFPEGVSSSVHNDAIVIYSIIENDKEVIYIVLPEEWNIEIDNKTSIAVTPINYNDVSNVNDIFRFKSDLDTIDYFYYSFFLDFKIDTSNWAGLKDISTSTLLCLQRKAALEERWMRNGVDFNEAITFDLQFLMKDELSKAIQFIISDNRNLIPFRIPEELFITISLTDRIYFNASPNDKNIADSEKQLNAQVKNLLNELDAANKNYPIKQQAINNLYIAILLNFLVSQFKYTSPVGNSNFNLVFNPKITIKDFVYNFFKNLSNNKTDLGDGKYYNNQRFFELSNHVPAFLLCFEDFIESNIITISRNNSTTFKLPLSQKADEDFNKLITFYMKSKGLTNFLEFSWRGLSTGEQSFLSFMSRFYHEKYHAIGSDQLKNNILIMIDEGDAGFHPDWQKSFFKKSLDFLSNLFKDHTLQLIYTANAPFIVSDLPKSNITFIDKKHNDIIILDKSNNKSETFGSNIHSLFTDSFFIEGAIMGDFAKAKIDEIITYLNSKNELQENEVYKKTIQQIGEPILKNKLQEMWDDKFNNSIDNELVILKNRIKVLNKIKQNKKSKI